MNGKIFLDTNILIYCYSTTELEKRNKAIEIASKENTIISTQVLKELSNVLQKKFRLEWNIILSTIEELDRNFEIYTNTSTSIKNACKIAERYNFSFYDSLIIASALESKCSILYSEDMQTEQIIEKKLIIKTPFI